MELSANKLMSQEKLMQYLGCSLCQKRQVYYNADVVNSGIIVERMNSESATQIRMKKIKEINLNNKTKYVY